MRLAMKQERTGGSVKRAWAITLRNTCLNRRHSIADAIAASAAVPGLIGPLAIRSAEYDWYRFKDDQLVRATTPGKRYELWDGGVYDNLDAEPLFKPERWLSRWLRLLYW